MTQREVEALIVSAWRRACEATPDRRERERRLACAVAGFLGENSIWKARRVYLLYLDHGIKRTNRAAITVATHPDFGRTGVNDRFRALDHVLAQCQIPARRGSGGGGVG